MGVEHQHFYKSVEEVDPEVAAALTGEVRRQRETLEMIASENFAPQAVLECQGSVLTNKYAEGYPGRRYYGGCEFVDVVESLAIERVKAIFNADHANVCAFRPKPATQSGRNQPPNPAETSHPIRPKAATCSG